MALRWLSVVILGAALLGACGDDSGSKAKDAGNNNDAGKTPAKDAGPAMITCGASKCTAPPIMLPANIPISADVLAAAGFTTEVCCAGAASAQVCGVTQSSLIPDGSCLAQGQVGRAANSEAECPSQSTTIMGFPFMTTGCCRKDNKCGVDLGLIGVGCLENSEANRISGMGALMSDAAVPMLPIKSCDYASPADAGHDSSTGGNDSGNSDAAF